jgi:hypothetical protein
MEVGDAFFVVIAIVFFPFTAAYGRACDKR